MKNQKVTCTWDSWCSEIKINELINHGGHGFIFDPVTWLSQNPKPWVVVTYELICHSSH